MNFEPAVEAAARAMYVEEHWRDRMSSRETEGACRDRAARYWDSGHAGPCLYRQYRRLADVAAHRIAAHVVNALVEMGATK